MRFIRNRFLLLWLIFIGLFVSSFHPAAAQEPKSQSPSSVSKGQKPSETGFTQLVLLADELAERSSALERAVANVFDKSAVEASYAEASKNLNDLFLRMEKFKASKRYPYDQIMELKAAALLRAKAVAELSASIQQAGLHLEAWSKEWQDQKKRWAESLSALPEDAPLSILRPARSKGQQAIDAATGLIARDLKPVLAAEQKAADLKARSDRLTSEIDDMLLLARRDIFRKPDPSMFSSDYYSQLVKGSSFKAVQDLSRLTQSLMEYSSKYGWVVFLQGLIFLIVAIGIRRHKRFFEGSPRWSFLSRRPFAAGFLAALTIWWLHEGPLPNLVSLIYLAVICTSTARLVGGLMTGLWRTRITYFLALLLIMTEALQVFEVPLPVFRLYTFFVSVAGFLLCSRRILKKRKKRDSFVFTWSLRAGVAVFAAVFIAEVGGYSALAAHLLEASLKTTFSLLVAWMFMAIADGGLEWAFQTARLQAVAFLQRRKEVIIHRLTVIIGFILGTFLLAANLVIWGFYESHIMALQGLLSLGVTLGTWRISLGLALTAAALLYGSFLASWIVQAVLMEGLFTKRELQTGVKFSMGRLIHYGFVLIGFFLAVAALGVDLQKITILAGALGVGIGFGLQTIVNNFVCGLILLFERPVKVGDLIQLDSEWAYIKKIGLRATIVETFDQAEVVVPNSDLVTNKVTNWTLSSRLSRLTIPVGVAYGSDVPLVLQILRDCAEQHPLVTKVRPPQVLFTDFGESSLDFELRVFVEDVANRLQVMSELHQAVDQRFREKGVEIPFPQRDIHIRSPKPSASAPVDAPPGTKDPGTSSVLSHKKGE
jgi:potassium efflux system protein